MDEELDQYRAIINLNKINKTLFISGNQNIFHYYYQNQDYIVIIIKDDQGNSIYSKNAKRKDTTLIFEDINNINYKNNYLLNIFFLEPWRGIYFDSQINKWISLQEKSVNFVIITTN